MICATSNENELELKRDLILLGLLKSESEDAKTLHRLFVEETLKEDNELLAFFPTQDRTTINQTAPEFRRQGVFDTVLGDFVMRVCRVSASAYHGSYSSEFSTIHSISSKLCPAGLFMWIIIIMELLTMMQQNKRSQVM